MRPLPKWLSKTKLMRGYRCHKCLYLTIHHPELETPIGPELQALFDQGNKVGEEARKYFPGGVLIDNDPWDFYGALQNTREQLAAGAQIIYEAAFEYCGCYARADIIQFSPKTKRWRIYEVKSTTKVKPEHLDDVGLQVWIMTKSGLPIEQINLLHLNTQCRFPDLSTLFTQHDITDDIRATYLGVQPKVVELYQTLKQADVPPVDIGPYCHEPNPCGFVTHCWQEKKIPPLSIFNLPHIRNRKWDLYHEGIVALDDPRLTDLNELQARMVTAYQTGERFVDEPVLKTALRDWNYPFIFLDFETINPAIPRYVGTGPFQQVPFQFSVHRQEQPQAPLTHQAYLHDALDDPRDKLIPKLLTACGTEGAIIAYYGVFEAKRIEELAQYAPDQAPALMQLVERIVDPLPMIRAAIYDNFFKGSFSLKNVGPALLGESFSYQDMLVADGGGAQRAFEKLISPHTSAKEKETLKQAMLAYCEKDTYVMVELVNWLYNACDFSS